MPLTALIRNLAKMTNVGLLAPLSAAARRVTDRLRDREALRKARIHPIAVLAAHRTYSAGKGVRGSLTWEPVGKIVGALDTAFYLAFDNVPATNKRWYLGLDVSGSMAGGTVAGVPGLTPRVASAALAMVTARTEPQYHIGAFSTEMRPVRITPDQRLDDVIKATDNIPFGGTDCAQPMLDALQRKIKADVFVIYTDSETWFGQIHPVQALQQYRERTGIPARLIVVGMVANKFSIADPNDAGMLDVVGFDTATPALIADFASDGATAAPAVDPAEDVAE
jgi:60 kDa SS-A/Ro ribonucleoprotein